MNPIPILLALLVIAWIWRGYFVSWYCIWKAKTPFKKEVHRFLYQFNTRKDEESAKKHLHNTVIMKAKEILEREESDR